MRPIKFRAWDKTEKKWIDKPFVVDNKGQVYFRYDGGGFIEKDIDLLQFTGLTDKNGKEIYEGDILEDLGKVIYIENEARFAIDILGETKEVEFWEIKQDELEVIGNIYENPELIGGNA